ncbi:MAG: helix-turn-helix transcriptional regulator [Lachnospiraceae bacterium]|nr:helix-turn-helix transcriptional regulator [Lachnospiraceae bacterium]
MNILEYENYQEKKSHGNPSFPYITYLCSIPLDFMSVPLHWHEEMEIIYIKKGKGIVTVDLENYHVSAGSMVLIIPGQLHSIHQYENTSMEYENIIFHPNILMSRQSDDCTTDFFQPLFFGTISLPTLLTPSLKNYKEIASCIDDADEICKIYPKAYQFALKSQLMRFFFLLFSTCAKEKNLPKNPRTLDKIKQIIKYIECNYMRKITIADISGETGLSQSHFMKYFKQTMGTSFIEYLNEYRLTMASRLLLSSDSSILDIANEVGFENLSYFNRLFKRHFGTTPSHYRKLR